MAVLELAERLVGLAFPAEGGAEVIVRLGVIRVEADGGSELAERRVNLAFCAEGGAEVVVRLGVIGFQTDGFLELAEGLGMWPCLRRASPRLSCAT